jgi:hypothetical protein
VTGLAATVLGGASALATMACGGPEWRPVSVTRPDERTPQTYCAATRDSVPAGRVINYVDPELCSRPGGERSTYTVRVSPQDALREDMFRARSRLAAAQQREGEQGGRP